MGKTPEELAEEFAEKVHSSLVQIAAVFLENERIFNYENMKDTFLAGYQAAKDQFADTSKVMPQWISVKDRLPKIEGEYLAFGYSASDAARWIVVMYDPRDKCWYELSSDWDWTDDITHWQELPEPPKKKK